jgi:hypothetical protein
MGSASYHLLQIARLVNLRGDVGRVRGRAGLARSVARADRGGELFRYEIPGDFSVVYFRVGY